MFTFRPISALCFVRCVSRVTVYSVAANHLSTSTTPYATVCLRRSVASQRPCQSYVSRLTSCIVTVGMINVIYYIPLSIFILIYLVQKTRTVLSQGNHCNLMVHHCKFRSIRSVQAVVFFFLTCPRLRPKVLVCQDKWKYTGTSGLSGQCAL